MKRNWFALLLGLLFLTITGVTACSPFSPKSSGESVKTAARELTPDEKAEVIVSKMTDSQKIGQLLMIGIKGTEVDGDARYMMTEFPMGNVILFDRNMKTPDQVRSLNETIRDTIQKQTGVSPLIAVDEEGGQVARMEDYLPPLPAASIVGQGSVDNAKNLAITTGKALKDLGFNTNFAPVVDLNSAYQRSYGKTPDTVIPFAKAVIDGYSEIGIRTSLKHFPGIGKVKTDPHIDGDVVSLTREQLDKEDGVPFRTLIGETDPTVTFIMVSNVTFPNLDPSGPACISKKIMTDILRKDYEFTGLILSDDMEMGAMAKHYVFSEMGVKAIEAGADIILVCHDYGHEQEVFNGLLKAYRNGTIDKKMVDEKVKRIVKTKMEL